MALEDKIDQLIKSVDALTSALGSAAPAAGGKASGGKASGGKASGGKKAVTLDTLAKRYGAYMAENDDGKANVRKVVAHFGVKKISDLPEDKYEEALSILDQIEAGESPFDEDDGSDLM